MKPRARLIEAIEGLLATSTFSELTIDALIDAADVSRSTLYANFADKAELLLAAAERLFGSATTAAGSWWELGPGAQRSDLESAIGAVFDLYREHEVVVRAVIEASASVPAVRARYVEQQQAVASALAEHIVAGQARGTVRRDLRPVETAGWLVWMLERGLHELVADASTAATGRLLAAVTDIVWITLYEAAPARNGI